MAEVYRPESDDHLSPYPRAPPPSPEAQHRTLGGIFEFPRNMFEGYGIDLKRTDFDFSENDDDFPSPNYEPTTIRRSSPKRAASSDTDDSDFEQPGSPMKRMCSAPSTMPNSFEVQGFHPNLLASTSCNIGNGGLLQPITTGDIKVSIPNFTELASANLHSPEHVRPQSHSNTTSPTLFLQQTQGRTPYSIPPRSNGSATPTHQPTAEHHDSSHLLSKSFDLHNVQSHFPANFDVTPPFSEVRPTRSRTLDTSTYSHESSIMRTRKVSLKRNYGELEPEPNLQFHFDYSYSSTGSSGESDWVVIESDLSSYPQGKKACCQQEPPSAAAATAMSKRHSSHLSGSPLHAANTTTTTVIGYNNKTAAANSNGLGSQEVAVSVVPHLGQSSSPLGVHNLNNGADLSSFPGGSAASNGSGSHSPLHTQLGMIHETNGLSSSAELHSAPSAGYMTTADAALAERSQHAEFLPQWSMEMMDCGDNSTRLDSVDSMDCGQMSDPAVAMQSLGGALPENIDDSLPFTNNYTTQLLQQQNQFQHHLNCSAQAQLTQNHMQNHHHNPPSSVLRSQSSEAALHGSETVSTQNISSSSSTTAGTRHSFIENYFISYHQNPSNNMTGSGGGVLGGGERGGTVGMESGIDARSSVSKSL